MAKFSLVHQTVNTTIFLWFKQAYNMGGLPRPVSSGHVPGLLRGNAPHAVRTQAPSSSTNSFNIVDLAIPSGLTIQRGIIMIGPYLTKILVYIIV